MIAASVPALALSICLLVVAYRSSGNNQVFHIQGDFQVYRWAVHTWLTGGDFVHNWAPLSNGKTLPWVYPPFALLPLAPFALLPMTVGVLLLWTVNVAAIGLTLYLVAHHLWPAGGRRAALAVAAAFLPLTLLLEPVHACFSQGQINLLLMGLIAADCLVGRPKWPRGTLIGIAAAIKLMPAAFVLYFVFRKDYRAALTATVSAAVCTLIGLAIAFEASMAYWFDVGPASSVAGHALPTNQSIMGALGRLELGLWRYLLWGGVSLLLAFALVRVLQRVSAPAAMTLTGLFALLVSPTSWSNHWVWVVPGLLILLASAVRDRGVRMYGVVWIYGVVGMVALVAVTAPFRLLDVDGGHAVLWLVRHIIGNAYILLGSGALLVLASNRTRGSALAKTGRAGLR